MPPVKPGYKTTEFWMVNGISLWSLLSPAIPPPWNIVVPMVVNGLYTISRGMAKAGYIRGTVGRELAAEPGQSS